MQLLSENEVHLWYLQDEKQVAEATLEAWRKALSEEEIEENLKFTFEEGRREHLISHGFVRDLLARYLDIEPSQIKIKKNQFGRPEIDNEAFPTIHFNVSHSSGFFACAIARYYEVGVDTENQSREVETLDIAESVFSPHEFAELKKLKGKARQEYFYQIWTLKEAYIKARGMGLSLSLAEFFFDLKDPSNIQIKFESTSFDSPEPWEFRLKIPQGSQQVALAYRSKSARPISVVENFFKSHESVSSADVID